MKHSHGMKEKKHVAFWSVFAAVFLTGSKLAIGLITGSLGILSEALHSALDLVAAVITFFSVSISDKPADNDHQYGHGKVENLSAFLETILLLITCVWIIYEASHRLITGKVHIEITFWSYAVVITSILIDYSRSRALMKTAKKYNSQALEADALHFSTDIWSSLVVLLGLICVNFGIYSADAISALIVAFIVIVVCYRLGKRSIDVLLDTAPKELVKDIEIILRSIPQVHTFHDVRVRNSGADTFVDVNIHLDPKMTLEEAHAISETIEQRICANIKRCSVHIHEEPEG